MDMRAIPCTDIWKAVMFYKSLSLDFLLPVSLMQLHVFTVKVGNYKTNYLVEKYASRIFRNPKNVFEDGVCYPSTSSSHKELSRGLIVVRLMRIFCENFLSLFLALELHPLLFSDILVSSGSTRLSIFIPKTRTARV